MGPPPPVFHGDAYLMVVRPLAFLLALLVPALPASADELVLKNGAILSGVVTEQGENVILQLDIGSMTIAKSQVREIRRSEDPLKEFEGKREKAVTAEDHHQLGLWARQKGLVTRANDMFRKALSLGPDHEEAHRALGHEKVDGAWMDADQAMAARGFVKVEGKWLKRETAEQFRRDATALEIERERGATSERIAKLQKEVELARIEVERERVREREERERRDWERIHYYRSSWITVPCRCEHPEHHGSLSSSAPVRVALPPLPKELPPLPPGPAPITPR